jgi:phosphoribosylaminoimidazolecarboxamide formyltransferase/IMP cyclohydrolase
VIVKHANPCGVAVGADALEAYSKAFKTDPTSAFGGIIALNRTLDGAAAQAISKQFVEVLMAPAFTAEALEVFKTKVNVRILQIDLPKGGTTDWEQRPQPHGRQARRLGPADADGRQQGADAGRPQGGDEESADGSSLQDLLFAWKVAKYVKSNAIVFCKDGMTMGVGAGQMSRWIQRASPASRPGMRG